MSGTADAVPLSSSTPQLPLSSINNLLRKSDVSKFAESQLTSSEQTEKHREAFVHYVEKWVDDYQTHLQNLEDGFEEKADKKQIPAPNFRKGLTSPNLFYSVYHLSNLSQNFSVDQFIEEIKCIEVDKSDLFTFGLMAQRFFFNEPEEVLQELVDSILEIDEELKSDLFSGTYSILLDFDPQAYLSELSKGWSGDVDMEKVETTNVSQPDKAVNKIREGVGAGFYQDLPPKIKVGIAQFIALPYVDNRTARKFYRRFGVVAEDCGLGEEQFCEWLNEIEVLMDMLSPQIESDERDEQKDYFEESFDALNSEIRDRVELQKYLEEHRSKAQRDFQNRLERIRERPEKIVQQYVCCGEKLAKAENNIFPYIWYALGHELLIEIILGEEQKEIFGKYMEWRGARLEREKNAENELIVTVDYIESVFS